MGAGCLGGARPFVSPSMALIVVVDPADYEAVVDEVRQGGPTPERRRALAAKAFAHVSAYDAVVAEYLRLGEDALAVAPGDDVGLVAALEAVARNDVLRAELRRRGRRVAARLSWEATAQQHIAIYEELR